MLAKVRPRSLSLVEELGMLIAKTRKMLFSNATRRLDESGESMLAWQVLAVLVRGGKCNQTDVAVALAQHPAGVSRLLDDLEKQGYVARSRDAADRRRVHVAATPEVTGAVDHVLEPLAEPERRALRDLLRKVVLQDPEFKNGVPHGGGGR